MVELSIIYDKVRFEEKVLYETAQSKGVKAQIVDAKTVTVSTDSKKKDFAFGDVIMQRSVSHYRGLYLTACLEHLDFNVINKFKVAETCGNKLITSLVLADNNVLSPRKHLAFSADGGREPIHKAVFPLGFIPIDGSWVR